MTVLEICIDSVESAIAAETGGAQQVELCSALIEGGLTPSLGLIRAVRSRIAIGLHVMIRPRSGDFLYSNDEFAVMQEDIRLAAQAGADGVVFGILTDSDDVDVERTRALVQLARPMEVTFHRAIDVTRDLAEALECIVRTGADRVLTSGAEPSAMAGRHTIEKLVRLANGRIRIMAGGNVRPQNLAEIAKASGAVEYHAALRHAVPALHQQQLKRIHLGDPRVDCSRTIVRAADVHKLRQVLDAVPAPA
jgi:copper homeostasis protein